MESIICIDLEKISNEQLREICSGLNIEIESLLNDKNKGFVKLWWCKKTFAVIAYTQKDDNTIKYTTKFTSILSSMENYSLKKEEKSKKIFNVDVILEKISKFGIQSLTKEEKEFLDNQN
jgi:hypothetical protein